MVVSFIGGGNWSTRRKPLTCRKALTNLLIVLYVHFDTNLRTTQYFFSLFLRMEEVELGLFFFVTFHYGLDHGLQFESYLKLIMKSNCWL